MKADMTALDCVGFEEPAVQPTVATMTGTEMREACRVPVRLQVAMGTGKQAFLTTSVDISETGVLIEDYDGPRLCAGDRVRVLIKGIIADQDTDEQFNTMFVVRATGTNVALAFQR